LPRVRHRHRHRRPRVGTPGGGHDAGRLIATRKEPAMSSVLLLALLTPAAEPGVAADLIVHNGKVWTGDAKQPEAQAVAVWRDRVLKVGTDAEVKALAGANTKLIDLKGGRIVPGFYDSHAH